MVTHEGRMMTLFPIAGAVPSCQTRVVYSAVGCSRDGGRVRVSGYVAIAIFAGLLAAGRTPTIDSMGEFVAWLKSPFTSSKVS